MTIGIGELPAEGILLPGVASVGADQRAATTEMSLVFATIGVTVRVAEPPSQRLLEWRYLETGWVGENVTLADGRTAAILEFWSAGERIQFLLASDRIDPSQVAYLKQAIPMWLHRYKVAPQPGTASVGTATVAGEAAIAADDSWGAAAAASITRVARTTPIAPGEPAGSVPAPPRLAAEDAASAPARPPAPSYAPPPPPAPAATPVWPISSAEAPTAETCCQPTCPWRSLRRNGRNPGCLRPLVRRLPWALPMPTPP